jgi:hypothetical protein
MTSSEALPVTIDIVCFCLLCVLCLVLEGGKEDGIVKKPKEEKNKTPVRNTNFFFHVVRGRTSGPERLLGHGPGAFFDTTDQDLRSCRTWSRRVVGLRFQEDWTECRVT